MSKPDTIFILKQIHRYALKTQDLGKTIRFINDYIERLERLS